MRYAHYYIVNQMNKWWHLGNAVHVAHVGSFDVHSLLWTWWLLTNPCSGFPGLSVCKPPLLYLGTSSSPLSVIIIMIINIIIIIIITTTTSSNNNNNNNVYVSGCCCCFFFLQPVWYLRIRQRLEMEDTGRAPGTLALAAYARWSQQACDKNL